MSWIDIGAIDDIPLRGARKVKTDMGCIAVFRTGEAEVFATSNVCPHKNGPLNEGIVHDRKITCPLHNWVFDLETGEALGADEGLIQTYPAKVEGGRVMISDTVLGQKAA